MFIYTWHIISGTKSDCDCTINTVLTYYETTPGYIITYFRDTLSNVVNNTSTSYYTRYFTTRYLIHLPAYQAMYHMLPGMVYFISLYFALLFTPSW